MKKFVSLLIIFLLAFSLPVGASDINENEAIELVRNASAVVLYSGPAYPLVQLTREKREGCPTAEEQESKYPDVRKYVVSDGGTVGECTYLSTDDLYSVLRYYFSKELADEYYEKSMKCTARNKDGGPKLREIDGVLYDFGNYGDPPGVYIIKSDFKKSDENRASLFLKYRPNSPPHIELEDTYEYEVFEYEFELEREDDGHFRFTRFTPIDDNAFRSVYPEYEYLYNPQTSDAPLIAVCAPALSALAAAVVLRKKRG